MQNEDIYKTLLDIQEDIGQLKGITQTIIEQATETNGRVNISACGGNTLRYHFLFKLV